jgi:Protein of unknown function (DUF1552)
MLKPLDRRTVLRGLLTSGAVATVGLPLLEIMLNRNGTALAQSTTPLPPLYVTWFFGNGTLPGLWKPAAVGSGANWALSHQLEPLAAVKSHLTVISGLEGKLVVSGVEHPSGSAAATTGAPISGNAVRAQSIDQLVATLIAGDTDFRSVEVGVTPATPNGNQDSLHTVSHNGPNSRNNPEFDPRAVFERLFVEGFEPPADDAGAEAAAKLARSKKSVLDSILEDGKRLQSRLGTTDRNRLEQHLEAIRAVERRLQTDSTPTTPACVTPMDPGIGPDTRAEAPPNVNTAMAELMALALACERTRVGTYTFSLPAAHAYYRHLGTDMNADFHDTICHTDAGDASNQPRVDTGVLYTMRCLNEFLVKLKETPHGDGSLLDASLVYVTSDTAWGKVHDRKEWPVLLAGKAQGRLRGDEHHNFPGENLSRALMTVANIMGAELNEYGIDGGRVNAELPGIYT